MHKIIICDTSSFIILSKIGELALLHKVYGTITTTSEIVKELGTDLPDWVSIENAVDAQAIRLLELQVDKGEASAIALALQYPGCSIILDDIRARRLALVLGIAVTGTIGIIIKAKLNQIIPSIKPFLTKIKSTNFRISEELEMQALIAANEN